MRAQISKKKVIDNYPNIICIGFAELQYLLYYHHPHWYTKGIYGWNADIYEMDGATAIVTGYRPFGNIKPDYTLYHSYEMKARDIFYDNNVPYEEKENKLNKLLNQFIKKVKS